MMRWRTTAALAMVLALLYLACKGSAVIESPEDSDVPPPAVMQTTADEAEPPVAFQEKQASEKKPPPAEQAQEKAGSKTSDKPTEKVDFADNAFPPTVSDTEYHKGAWYKDDCLRCHETGVEEATVINHKNLPDILLTAKCRSCHVLIPGKAPVERKKTEDEARFADNAFPPMMPASDSHKEAWLKDNCMLCHETGVRGAPIVKHKDLPKVLLKAKCRSCHVQVRRTSVPGK